MRENIIKHIIDDEWVQEKIFPRCSGGTNMTWIELKRSLLYGQPGISKEMLQPQTVRTAVHEIARLVTVGWIDQPTDDMVSRIKNACQMSECGDVWDELEHGRHPLLNTRKRRTPNSRKRKVA